MDSHFKVLILQRKQDLFMEHFLKICRLGMDKIDYWLVIVAPHAFIKGKFDWVFGFIFSRLWVAPEELKDVVAKISYAANMIPRGHSIDIDKTFCLLLRSILGKVIGCANRLLKNHCIKLRRPL